ncbi:hypothetical protein [Bacillus sp. TH13]|nr:hypothetical protein [Bacillus sp. TH13]MBK5493196.1 hypothetical protein [Bacillus sp. TH13]
MSELFVNMVLKEIDAEMESQYFRLLWIDSTYEHLVWFNLVEKNLFLFL